MPTPFSQEPDAEASPAIVVHRVVIPRVGALERRLRFGRTYGSPLADE
jgi:hypothetical protein